jgi:phosphoglycerate dehydrogenase-like enzyme
MELDGKTIAVCGFGRIGRLVAARARAFGMRIVVFDPYVKAEAPALKEADAALASSLEDALAAADVVSVHSALTEETRHLFNAKTLAAAKPGALLINASRGGVVDEAALVDALKSGHLGGAALDVREIEPPPRQAELEAMDNVVLTPHCASFTKEAQARTLQAVAEDVDRVLRGEEAVNYVNFGRAG